MQRSRRNNVNKRSSAIKEEINILKNARNSGKSRIETYKEQHHETEGILQELTEEEYSQVVRSRISSDFVIDDDGSGYVDHGYDDYEDEYNDYSEEEEYHSKKKRKRDDKEDKIKSKNIKQMFSKIKPKPSKKQITANNNVDDDAFMSSLLGDLESEVMHNENEPSHTSEISIKESNEEKINKNVNLNTKIKKEDNYDFDDIPINTKIKKEDNYDFDDIPLDTFDTSLIELTNVKKEITTEIPKKIKVEEEEKPKIKNEAPILSPYKIKKEIVTIDASNIKKENKIEINKSINQMEMTPTKDIKIKKEIEASLSPKIGSPQQEWVNIHKSVSNNKYNSITNNYNDQKIEFEEKNGEYFLFYWIDAMENQGTVYLLGKVYDKRNKKFVSCCLTVNNVMRNLFVLPRNYLLNDDGEETEKEVEMVDIYNELEVIRKKNKISSWKCKYVKRKYAFEEPDVPAETTYIKTVYSFKGIL